MGGTATDVSHYAGEYERAFETEVAGVRVRAPMIRIHTVAAGGGSQLTFDGARLRVGPLSAGASPGPACYRRGGPLTITDANVMLGRIQPAYFPRLFGPNADEPLDREVVIERFSALAAEMRCTAALTMTNEELAEGFVQIAVTETLSYIGTVEMREGDVFVIETPGGGGFGAPE